MSVKYFSKKPAETPQTKQFSEGQGIDAAVVKTLCGVVDGLQAKVAEMADELAALKDKKAEVVQNASTEEGEHIEEPKGDPVQEPQQIPEEVANGVADDPKPEYTSVPEETVISQFSNPKSEPAKEEEKPFLMGKESFNCLLD